MKFFVVVKPGAGKELVEETEDGVLKISVKEAPEKGKANAAAVKVLAKFLNIHASAVRLVSGASSRKKVFEVKI